MSLTNVLMFAGAYLAVVALPGPGVTAVVARTLAQGTRGSQAFIAGCATGALFWFVWRRPVWLPWLRPSAPCSSPCALPVPPTCFTSPGSFGPDPLGQWAPANRPEGAMRLFGAGLAVNLGNPKSMVFFLALLPTALDLRLLTVTGFLELAATVVLVVASVFTAYVLAAERARRVFTSPRACMRIKRGSAVATAAAAVAVAAR